MILEITLGATCVALGFVVIAQRIKYNNDISQAVQALESVEEALIKLIGRKIDKLSIKEITKDEVVLQETKAKKRGRPVGSKNKKNDRRRKVTRS